MSVRPRSCACHQEILPQVDLGAVGIEHYRLTYGFLRPMFSMRPTYRVVGQKH